jgi:hypothetical protein
LPSNSAKSATGNARCYQPGLNCAVYEVKPHNPFCDSQSIYVIFSVMKQNIDYCHLPITFYTGSSVNPYVPSIDNGGNSFYPIHLPNGDDKHARLLFYREEENPLSSIPDKIHSNTTL